MLADRLAAAGCRVLLVWVTAALEVTLQRLAGRRSRTVPVSREEAEWIYGEATRRAAARSVTAVLDTSGTPDPSKLDQLALSSRGLPWTLSPMDRALRDLGDLRQVDDRSAPGNAGRARRGRSDRLFPGEHRQHARAGGQKGI